MLYRQPILTKLSGDRHNASTTHCRKGHDSALEMEKSFAHRRKTVLLTGNGMFRADAESINLHFCVEFRTISLDTYRTKPAPFRNPTFPPQMRQQYTELAGATCSDSRAHSLSAQRSTDTQENREYPSTLNTAQKDLYCVFSVVLFIPPEQVRNGAFS